MAKAILTNMRIFAGATDLTGAANNVDLEATAEALDVTTFGSVDANGVLWKEMLPSIEGANVTVGGFWEAGSASFVDDDQWANFGGIGPWSIGPTFGTEGTLAYLINAVRTNYSLLGATRTVAPFNAQALATGAVARGAVLLSPGTARTASGAGTVVQLGAVPAGRAVRAGIHVVSIAGTTPTMQVILQSAAAIGFASPTTRATFTLVNGAAGTRAAEWQTGAVGAITDQFWRMSYTITGTTPSYLVLGTAGIV
jgi:hypothetical protein